MDGNDQRAIAGLFEKLATVEKQSPPRDPEAEAFIRDQVARQSGAPYYMAQTIVVQEQALNAAQARIEELEYAASRPAAAGGLFGGLFGGGQRQPIRSGMAPRIGSRAQPQGQYAQEPQRGQGGGFLAGAAQTAMGVAGGVLLANAIGGMFGGNEAQAAEAPEPTAADEGASDAGFDDGGDFGEF